MTAGKERIIDVLITIVLEDLGLGPVAAEVTGTVPLMDGGLDLDSVAIVELIGIVEERFGFQFDDEDLRPSTFESLSKLVEVIEKHKAGAD